MRHPGTGGDGPSESGPIFTGTGGVCKCSSADVFGEDKLADPVEEEGRMSVVEMQQKINAQEAMIQNMIDQIPATSATGTTATTANCGNTSPRTRPGRRSVAKTVVCQEATKF
ncbi:hypothetical protein PV326_012573 [Microctonus aethiopoides]|nr:hypothetical protein PV326_012573 [Microctonus aethiopoides]